jgi:hypothetical protein
VLFVNKLQNLSDYLEKIITIRTIVNPKVADFIDIPLDDDRNPRLPRKEWRNFPKQDLIESNSVNIMQLRARRNQMRLLPAGLPIRILLARKCEKSDSQNANY